MKAKDSALGAGVPGGGVPSKRAQAAASPGVIGNGTRASLTGEDAMGAGDIQTSRPLAADSVVPALASSFRTVILGIDYDGRIVQHDRNAPQILAREPEDLLGAQLSDLTIGAAGTNSHAARQADGVAAVAGLLEAMRSDPEGRAERFGDPAVMRKQMLDDTFPRIGDTLDIDHLARELMDALVPHFCNAGDLLLLEGLIGNDELPPHGPDGMIPARRVG